MFPRVGTLKNNNQEFWNICFKFNFNKTEYVFFFLIICQPQNCCYDDRRALVIDIYFLIYPLNTKRQHLFSKSLTSQVIIVKNVIFLKKKNNVFLDITVVKCWFVKYWFSHQCKYDSVISQGVKQSLPLGLLKRSPRVPIKKDLSILFVIVQYILRKDWVKIFLK